MEPTETGGTSLCHSLADKLLTRSCHFHSSQPVYLLSTRTTTSGLVKLGLGDDTEKVLQINLIQYLLLLLVLGVKLY